VGGEGSEGFGSMLLDLVCNFNFFFVMEGAMKSEKYAVLFKIIIKTKKKKTTKLNVKYQKAQLSIV